MPRPGLPYGDVLLNGRMIECEGRKLELDVLRVFCGTGGTGGNPLGVVRDGAAVPDRAARAALAAELGFSETVFLDDETRGTVDIHTPSVRLPFAGHPLVGLAWLLRSLGRPLACCVPRPATSR